MKDLDKPQIPEIARSTEVPNPVGFRSVGFEEGRHDTPVYRREELNAGDEVHGPAVVEEAVSVVILHPDQEMSVDRFGNLHITAR